MELPFTITFRNYTFKIMNSSKYENTIEVALMSKPYEHKGEITDRLIYSLFYYLQQEGFIDDTTELD
jgi:hypothetical protein